MTLPSATETPFDSAALRAVFARQQAARPRLRARSAGERQAVLRRLEEAMLARKETIRAALRADFGRADVETDLTETGPVVWEARHTRRHLRSWMKPRRVATPMRLSGTSASVRVEPRGTALIISPWNYPINLTLGPLVGAIAAGCPAIIKPSEFVPHSSALIEDIVSDLFPEDEVAVVQGDRHAAEALLALPFDHIYFTGSPAVGRIVMRAAAEHLSSITLELGGKSPTIIDETADLKIAARRVVVGKFTNAGQTCLAPDHLYVHEAVYEPFVALLQERIDAAFGSDPTDSDLANLVSDRHFERTTGLVHDAVSDGAHVVTGSNSTGTPRRMHPTLLTDVAADSRVMSEEIFGPVLPVLRYSSLDTVIDEINGRDKPLALYIFSRSAEHIDRVLEHTSAGGTCVNDTLLHFLNLDLPFGGIGSSGIGRGHGHAGFMAFSNERAVLRQRLKWSPLQLFHAPYSERAKKLSAFILRWL